MQIQTLNLIEEFLMSLTVKHIFVHPVKSMAGQMVDEAALTAVTNVYESGLEGIRQLIEE